MLEKKTNPDKKPPLLQAQDLVLATHTSDTTRRVQSPSVDKLGPIVVMGWDQGRQRGRAGTAIQAQYSESDSDDAFTTMLRSIAQVSAMYNQEPQQRTDAPPNNDDHKDDSPELGNEDVSTDLSLKLASAPGTPECK